MKHVFVLIAFLSFSTVTVEQSIADTGKSKQKAVLQKDAETPAGARTELETLRMEIRKGKTELISNAINISDAGQAAKFWDLYRGYETELRKVGDSKVSLIEDYLKNYSTMNDQIASSLMDRALANQEQVLKLRKEYASKISREVSPIVAARFLQIEGYVQKYLDLEIDSSLPLIQR